MSATAANIADLRAMVAEPTTTTYTDAELVRIIEQFPLVDADGLEPDEDDWEATYDVNAAAAHVWGRKAAALVGLYDFSADGGTFNRSQAAKEMRAQARFYAARRSPRSLRVSVSHELERDLQGKEIEHEEVVVNESEDEYE